MKLIIVPMLCMCTYTIMYSELSDIDMGIMLAIVIGLTWCLIHNILCIVLDSLLHTICFVVDDINILISVFILIPWLILCIHMFIQHIIRGEYISIVYNMLQITQCICNILNYICKSQKTYREVHPY